MDIRPIRTEADYRATLQEISGLMAADPDLGTPEGDRLDILTTLVHAYEARHVMATLTVRNLPDEVHRALGARAAQHGQSVEAEVRAILEAAVRPESRLRWVRRWQRLAARSA